MKEMRTNWVRVNSSHAPTNGGRISFYVCHVQGLMCTVAHIMTAVTAEFVRDMVTR